MPDLHPFPVERIRRLRRAAARAARFPADGPEGWGKSPVDPCRVLRVFPLLRLLPGYTLRAYQFRSGGNGNAVVYAMPVDSPFPDPEECPSDEERFLEPPVPPGALRNVMAAIDGDGSPESYMQSSIFAREIAEFGALWHDCEWSDQSILAANPAESRPGKTEPSGPWEWTEPAPVEWLPTVTIGDEVVVQFYTYTIFGGERITRHIDSYRLGSYVCTTETEVIATGPNWAVY
jgi:hypothetical protein